MWYVSTHCFQPRMYIGIVTAHLLQEKKVILMCSHVKKHWVRRQFYGISLWKSGWCALLLFPSYSFKTMALTNLYLYSKVFILTCIIVNSIPEVILSIIYPVLSLSVFLSHKDHVDSYLDHTYSDLGVGPNSQYFNWTIILSVVKWWCMDKHFDKILQRSLRITITDGLLICIVQWSWTCWKSETRMNGWKCNQL